MKENINFKNIQIGKDSAPFIVAEMSGNHNQSLERALKIVDAAAEAGVDAVKIQTYTADTMTLDIKEGEFLIQDPKSLWKGETLYHLYEKAHTPWEWHDPIFKRCQEKGIVGFSTPFDKTAVDYLEKLNAPLYKIASFENTDIPLIEAVAKTKKPLVISTGMASEQEIKESVEAARNAGCEDLILLKCTSAYPANAENSHLNRIPHMRETFDCLVGLSDHTLGIGVSVASVSLGACFIERHFTLSRKEGGVDAAFSLELQEMAQLVTESKRAWKAQGTIHYGPTESEKKSIQFRRSLYIAKDMKAGETLNSENLRTIRPGYGLAPKFYHQILGKKVKKDVKRGTAVQLEMVDLN